MCFFDACGYPPLLADIFVEGTKRATAVRDARPSGATAALEF